MGRKHGPVHQRGPDGGDDATAQTRRPPGDPYRPRRRLPLGRLSRQRLPIRVSLTLVYGGLFVAVGAVLLLINYLLVRQQLPHPIQFAQDSTALTVAGTADASSAPDPVGATQVQDTVLASTTRYRNDALSTLLTQSAIALIVAAVLAILLGWLMAGRVLRPLAAITATAQRLSVRNLKQRIELAGPQDEIKTLANTFDAMLDRLTDAFDSQKHFVANASHELRTPLALQRTLVEVALQDPTLTPRVRTLGHNLLEANQRTEQLIASLLLLARSDRGLAEQETVQLDTLVNHVAAAREHQLTQAGLDLVISSPDPQNVLGDPMLLEQLVGNLLDNAIKYNRPDGWIRIRLDQHPTLTITNSGPTIPADAIEGLFEPFKRRATDRTDPTGTGLGLSIVQSIAHAHHGTRTAQPGPEGGLTITVDLPTSPTGGTA